MSLGWRLFMHSVRQLLLNIGPAVQISWLPFAIFVVVSYWAIQSFAGGAGAVGYEFGENAVPAGFLPRILLVLVVFYFCFVWVAVNWHRYVLLSEHPGTFGRPPNTDRMWAYFKVSLIIFLVMILILIGFAILMGILGPLLLIPGLGIVVGLVIQAVASALFLRISVPLPAAAIGETLTISDAMVDTRGSMFPIIVLSLCIAVLTLIPQLLLQTPLAPIVTGLIYQVAAQWLLTMLGISVLTTLYGYYIERRELLV